MVAGSVLTMALSREHAQHFANRSRNFWLAGALGAFVALVFAVTIVKLSSGHEMEAFDHAVRPSLLE